MDWKWRERIFSLLGWSDFVFALRKWLLPIIFWIFSWTWFRTHNSVLPYSKEYRHDLSIFVVAIPLVFGWNDEHSPSALFELDRVEFWLLNFRGSACPCSKLRHFYSSQFGISSVSVLTQFVFVWIFRSEFNDSSPLSRTVSVLEFSDRVFSRRVKPWISDCAFCVFSFSASGTSLGNYVGDYSGLFCPIKVSSPSW